MIIIVMTPEMYLNVAEAVADTAAYKIVGHWRICACWASSTRAKRVEAQPENRRLPSLRTSVHSGSHRFTFTTTRPWISPLTMR